MPSRYWIKLYHEILGDPKMALLSHRLWRRTIECFLMAGEVNDEGTLPSIDQIAWTLRLSIDEAKKVLVELEHRGTVKFDANIDRWFVINFARRQEVATGAERMRRYRAEKRSCDKNVTSDVGDKIRKEKKKIRTNSPSASGEPITPEMEALLSAPGGGKVYIAGRVFQNGIEITKKESD